MSGPGRAMPKGTWGPGYVEPVPNAVPPVPTKGSTHFTNGAAVGVAGESASSAMASNGSQWTSFSSTEATSGGAATVASLHAIAMTTEETTAMRARKVTATSYHAADRAAADERTARNARSEVSISSRVRRSPGDVG